MELKENEAIIKKNNLSSDQIEFINSVLNKYGGLSSFNLELLSHSEAPWIEARNGYAPHQTCNVIIPKKRMHEYYSGM